MEGNLDPRGSEDQNREPWGEGRRGALRTPITPRAVMVPNGEDDKVSSLVWQDEAAGSVYSCYRPQRGRTSRGRLASVMLWAGPQKLTVNGGNTWIQPQNTLRRECYRAGAALGSVLWNEKERGMRACLPTRIAVYSVPVGEIVFVGADELAPEEKKGQKPLGLIGLNHRNNDVAPIGPDGVQIGDFFLVGESAKNLRKAASTLREAGAVLVIRPSGSTKESSEIRGLFIVPVGEEEETGRTPVNVAPYFKTRVPLSLFGGSMELAVCLLSLYCVYGQQSYHRFFSEAERLILVKTVSTPDVSITVSRISFKVSARISAEEKRIVTRELQSEDYLFSFVKEMNEFATRLDQVAYIPDGELMLGKEIGKRRLRGVTGQNPLAVFASYLRLRDEGETYLRKELHNVSPEDLKAQYAIDPATDWMAVCLGATVSSYIAPRTELLGGRLPLASFVPFSWFDAVETQVPYLSRMMDLHGGVLSLSKIVGSWDSGYVNGMVFMAAEMIRPGETAIIITTNSIPVEARPEMVEAMEAIREASKLAGGCRVGRLGRLAVNVAYEQRGRSPVSREAFYLKEKKLVASAALTKPAEVRTTHVYYGLPVCLPNEDPLIRREERERQRMLCARANSLIVSSADFFQFDVKGKAILRETGRLAVPWSPPATLAGLTIRPVVGVRVARLVKIAREDGEGSRVAVEFSEIPRFRGIESERRILARLVLHSFVDVGDSFLAQVFQASRFALGETILRYAANSPYTIGTGMRRPIPSDEGTQVPASFIESGADSAAMNYTLGDQFTAVDSWNDGTVTAHQLYRNTSTGLEVAISSSLADLAAKGPGTSLEGIVQRREPGFKEVGDTRLCWVFKLGLVETPPPKLEAVTMMSTLDVHSVIVRLGGRRELTRGSDLLRYCSDRINQWAEEYSRETSTALLSWTMPQAQYPRLEWRIGEGELLPARGSFRMTAASTSATQVNYFLLLRASRAEALEIQKRLSRQMRTLVHPTRLADRPPIEEEKAGIVRDIYGNYSRVDEELAEHFERCQAALREEDHRRVEIRKTVLAALASVTEGRDGNSASLDKQLAVLSYWGWDYESVTNLFLTSDGYRIEEKEQVVEEIASARRLAQDRMTATRSLSSLTPKEPLPLHLMKVEDDPEAKIAFTKRSSRLIVVKGAPFPTELPGDFEAEPILFWEAEQWCFNPKKQVTRILRDRKMDLPRPIVTLADRQWTYRLEHVFGDAIGLNSQKRLAERGAYMNWLRMVVIPEIVSAPLRDISYQLYDSSRVSLIPANGDLMMCGLDTERDSSGNLTTVQIAAMDAQDRVKVFLWVRTNAQTKCPQWLRDLLSNDRWAKCAFDQGADRAALLEAGINVTALFELKEVAQERGWGPRGLAAVVRTLVGMELKKERTLRVSFQQGITWSNLSPEQRTYAADDAVASLLLGPFMKKLEKESGRSRFAIYDPSSIQVGWEGIDARLYDGPPFESSEVRHVYSRELFLVGGEIVLLGPVSSVQARIVAMSILQNIETGDENREWHRYLVAPEGQILSADLEGGLYILRATEKMLPQDHRGYVRKDPPKLSPVEREETRKG